MYHYFARTFHVVKIAVLVILIVRTFLIEPGVVNGRSMEHTFIDNDFFLVDKIALLFREPRRGDIVIVQEPYVNKIMIKRVVGLPGERIYMDRNGVFIQDDTGTRKLLREPYLEPDILTRSPSGKPELYTKIPPHAYFLLGDNRPMSTDSRVFGSFQRKDIYGLVINDPFSKKKS